MLKIELPADLTLPRGKVEGHPYSSSIIKSTTACLVGGERRCTDHSTPQIKANAILRLRLRLLRLLLRQLQSKSNLFIAKSRKRGVSSAVYEVWPLSVPAACCRHIFGQPADGRTYAIIRKYSAPSGGQPDGQLRCVLHFVCSLLMPSNVANKCICLSLDTDEC